MFCMKCGTNIPDDAQFCMSCGTATRGNSEDSVKMVHLKCRECNGTMEADPNSNTLVCPYCGSKDIMVESDEVKIEQIKSDTYKTVELAKQQNEMEKMKLEEELREKSTKNYDKSMFIFFMSCILAYIVIKLLGIE